MRVLYFHQYFGTPQGKSGIRSYEMSKYLIEKGHEVTVIFASSERRKSPLGDRPFRYGMRRGVFEDIDLIELNVPFNHDFNIFQRSLIFFKFIFHSIRFVFTEKYDVLLATSTPLTIGVPGIIMKIFYPKKSFVFEVRDLWPELPREMGVIKNKLILWIMGVLEFFCYNKADVCIALSPGIKHGIEKRLKKRTPVYLVPNGSDLDLFKPGSASKTVFPGCTDSDFVAIFTGAHGTANGLDAALNAAKALQKSNAKYIKLVFIGSGNQKERLINRVKEEEIENCIFMDPVSKVNLVKLLQAADIGLMILANVPAFYYGTSPNKFFDYISAGLPVLNNYPGWLADMIVEKNLGKVVPPDAPEVFAQSLLDMSTDQTQLREMGRNARQFAESQFNRQLLASKFLEALDYAYRG